MSENPKYNLCVLTTVSVSIKCFYQGLIDALNKAGFETTVICADKLKKLLSGDFRYGIYSGLVRTIKWYKSRGLI